MENKMNIESNKKKVELDNALTGQIHDMAKTGATVPVEPDTADMMGAFEETALDSDDALDSRFDKDDEGTDE
jgi:hypothetical protein